MYGCGYNTLQRRDERVKQAWANTLTAYQKRHDLVPNLVAVVEGYASHEKDVMKDVAQARASLGGVAPPREASPEQMKEFVDNQARMTSALSRLLVIAENYPKLKADKSFLELQSQLVNIENQIAANRNIYTREVRDFNIVVRTFPTNVTARLFGIPAKPQLQVDDERAIRSAPVVNLKRE
jgi:LemA protein